MKIKKQALKDSMYIFAGIIINVNILTAIATSVWPIMVTLFDIGYPGWWSIQALCLCVLSLSVQPLSKTIVDQMWERFYTSTSIIAYVGALWAMGLIKV